MKQVLLCAVVAAVVAVAVLQVAGRRGGDAQPQVSGGAQPEDSVTAPVPAPAFRVTDELIEDGWVDGTRAAGADHKPLEHSSSSICFLTKIEIKGVQGPEDANSCTIGIDEFTGYWQVTAAVAEGGQSQVRCNARCLVWE